ncbi:MAG: PKD domain-containing protein [Candidatus Diapherotrites archaeon]
MESQSGKEVGDNMNDDGVLGPGETLANNKTNKPGEIGVNNASTVKQIGENYINGSTVPVTISNDNGTTVQTDPNLKYELTPIWGYSKEYGFYVSGWKVSAVEEETEKDLDFGEGWTPVSPTPKPVTPTPTPTITLTPTPTLTPLPNQAPTADFEMYPEPANGMVPLTVKFKDKSFDPDGSIVSWNWEFGVGTIEGTNCCTNKETSHVYTSAGYYTVRLTVTDNLGATASNQKSIIAIQKAAITIFKSNNPENPNQPAQIIIACGKQAALQLEFLDKDSQPLSGVPTQLMDGAHGLPFCNITPTILNITGFPKPGLYQIKANILGEECTNCPKTIHIVVGQEMPELQTPEIPAILTAVIALAVIVITNRKKK